MTRKTVGQGRLLATAIGAAGVVLWATETALITFTIHLPPLQTVALAFGAAALLSPLIWWITGADPLAAFRQPIRVWILTVGSLVGFHACIYYAVQNAPPATAALLQGTTPLMIVLGSALLPGERLRWWHLTGAAAGLAGVMFLVTAHASNDDPAGSPVFYLAIVGAAAAIWGLYSLYARIYSHVPTSAMGVFFAASAIVAGAAHFGFENWTPPSMTDWAAIAALGVFPMGLALFFWDFGVKRGDIQALGAFSYVEPYLGAGFVVLLGQGHLSWSLFWAGFLIIGGAALASRGVWDAQDSELVDQHAREPGPKPPTTATDAEALMPFTHRRTDHGDPFRQPGFLMAEITGICDELTALLAWTESKSCDEHSNEVAFRVTAMLQQAAALIRMHAVANPGEGATLRVQVRRPIHTGGNYSAVRPDDLRVLGH